MVRSSKSLIQSIFRFLFCSLNFYSYINGLIFIKYILHFVWYRFEIFKSCLSKSDINVLNPMYKYFNFGSSDLYYLDCTPIEYIFHSYPLFIGFLSDFDLMVTIDQHTRIDFSLDTHFETKLDSDSGSLSTGTFVGSIASSCAHGIIMLLIAKMLNPKSFK